MEVLPLMALNATPGFISAVRHNRAAISTANTNRDGTGTIGDVMTGVAAGTRVDRVVIIATGTTTAGMVRLYHDDGTNHDLLYEQPIAAITPSATVQAARYEVPFSDFLLPSSSDKLRASTHNAESFIIHAYGGDFT